MVQIDGMGSVCREKQIGIEALKDAFQCSIYCDASAISQDDACVGFRGFKRVDVSDPDENIFAAIAEKNLFVA